ncbi:hypothetical protein II906_00065, partial [bacterium]|nr:hypothetical protein [bacterium]
MILLKRGNNMQKLENEPIELEPNLTIKYFRLQIDTSVDDGELFEYKSNDNEKILSYHKDGYYAPDNTYTVKIEDKKFDEYVLEMIKYFHEDFEKNPATFLFDDYKFKAVLSNGQELNSKGSGYCPITYEKFIAYLNNFLYHKGRNF